MNRQNRKQKRNEKVRKRKDCRGLWRKEEKGRMNGRKKRGGEARRTRVVM